MLLVHDLYIDTAAVQVKNKSHRKLENNNTWNSYFRFCKIITVRPRNIFYIIKFSWVAADMEVNESIFEFSTYFSEFSATFDLGRHSCKREAACSCLDTINWTLIEVVRGRKFMTIVIPSQLAQVVTFVTSPNLGYKIGRS
jgi:hypothetical protein